MQSIEYLVFVRVQQEQVDMNDQQAQRVVHLFAECLLACQLLDTLEHVQDDEVNGSENLRRKTIQQQEELFQAVHAWHEAIGELFARSELIAVELVKSNRIGGHRLEQGVAYLPRDLLPLLLVVVTLVFAHTHGEQWPYLWIVDESQHHVQNDIVLHVQLFALVDGLFAQEEIDDQRTQCGYRVSVRRFLARYEIVTQLHDAWHVQLHMVLLGATLGHFALLVGEQNQKVE